MDPSNFLQRQDVSMSQLEGPSDTPTSKSMHTPLSIKTNGKSTAGSAAPRIDTEPIYTALKAALGEGFGTYRDAIAKFVLGTLNQAELTNTLSRLLSTAPSVSVNTSFADARDAKLTSTTHLHNQLLCALYANIFRDAPPDTIAPWVLAPDDATGLSQHAGKGGAAGRAADEAEERLKREVMALSGRDRRRIKSVKDASTDAPTLEIRDAGPLAENVIYNQALTIPTSKVDVDPLEGKGNLGKTNWDIEIRRRYAQPLAAETLEFPSRAEIQSRIEPICYEEGVGLTASQPLSNATLQACAELVETATEVFIKETLERWISAARTNGEGMPTTAAFRSHVQKETAAVERGELARTPAGLLPCEAEVAAKREPLSADELRLSLRLDEGRLVHDHFLADRILGDIEVDLGDAYDVATPPDLPHLTNGIVGLTNGVKEGTVAPDSLGGDPMVVDEEEGTAGAGWWHGESQDDRDALMGVLDSALSVGF